MLSMVDWWWLCQCKISLPAKQKPRNPGLFGNSWEDCWFRYSGQEAGVLQAMNRMEESNWVKNTSQQGCLKMVTSFHQALHCWGSLAFVEVQWRIFTIISIFLFYSHSDYYFFLSDNFSRSGKVVRNDLPKNNQLSFFLMHIEAG